MSEKRTGDCEFGTNLEPTFRTSSGCCYRCGSPLGTTDSDGCCSRCKNLQNPQYTSPIPHGWQCPRCGTIYAPWVDRCYCLPPLKTT